MTAEIEQVFENRINNPFSEVKGGLLGSSTAEDRIIWKSGGVRDRLVDLENQVASLTALLAQTPSTVDLDPDPSLEATTYYEMASDGALVTGVQVTTSGGDYAMEVALLGAPTVAYAVKDAMVDSANPTTNTDALEAGADPGVHRGWMQWAWGSWVASGGSTGLWAVDPLLALVRLCKNGVSDVDDCNISLYPETFSGGDWGEGTITWDTQPALEEAEIAHWNNRSSDTYNWFDVTKYMLRLRSTKDNSLAGEPYGLVARAQDEDTISGTVTYYTRGEATAARKPQLWYWESALKTVILGPTLRDAKFVGTPGVTNYLVHRVLDKNNVPGRWSVPVAITLPSQGATPDTPSLAVSRLNPNCLTQVVITYTEPVDFLHYEIEERLQSDSSLLSTIVTSAARFVHQTYARGDDDTKFRVRAVTRSGVASSWSAYQDNDAPAIMRYTGGAAEVRMSSPSTDDINLHTGDVGKLYKSKGVASPKEILTPDEFASKDLDFNMIEHSCGQATNDSQQSTTTSGSWVDRTTGSVTLTPPGTGNAYYLLIARATVFKSAADGMKLTFKVDGTETNAEEAWSSSSVAETVTIVRRVAVSSGSSHTFKLCFKSNDGGECIVYKSVVIALHLGNY